jgi:hypothetical protein
VTRNARVLRCHACSRDIHYFPDPLSPLRVRPVTLNLAISADLFPALEMDLPDVIPLSVPVLLAGDPLPLPRRRTQIPTKHVAKLPL